MYNSYNTANMSDVEYKISEARDKISAIYDRASRGAVTVISKGAHRGMAAVPAAQLSQALALIAPLSAEVSFSKHSVAAWLNCLPVHATGADLDEAVEELALALLDYAEQWEEELRLAPNHRDNWAHVARVRLLSHDELLEALFGEDAE